MQGCEVVIHTASPFVVTNYKDAVKDIIEPAVKGTENVLDSVNRTESVKRVVLTSSIASTYGDAIEIQNTANNEFDESHWNNTVVKLTNPIHIQKSLLNVKLGKWLNNKIAGALFVLTLLL
jgi:dihydroflavonol-4-reductase